MKATLTIPIIIYMILISFHLASAQSKDSATTHEAINISNPVNHLLYSDDDIYIEHIHPNPANDLAFIDYQLSGSAIGAKIVLHNVLGGLINEYDLDYTQTRLKIPTSDLKPGVYFYTLYVNNENLVTKKVIIKR